MTWIYSSSDTLIGRGWGWEMPAVVGGGLCLYDWKRRPPLSLASETGPSHAGGAPHMLVFFWCLTPRGGGPPEPF